MMDGRLTAGGSDREGPAGLLHRVRYPAGTTIRSLAPRNPHRAIHRLVAYSKLGATSRDDAVTKATGVGPTRRLTSSARSSPPIPGRRDLFSPVRDLPPQPVLAAVDDRGRSRVRQAAHYDPDRRAIVCPAHTRPHAFRYVCLFRFLFLILIA